MHIALHLRYNNIGIVEMAKTTLNLRVDAKLKKEAESIISGLGLSMTGAVNVYLMAIVREKGIPFSVKMDNTPIKKKGSHLGNEDFELSEKLPGSDSIKEAINKL